MDKLRDCSTCSANLTNKTNKRPEKLDSDLLKRMNKIIGQANGVKGMIERGVYCDDILNQISAVQSALSSVSKLLLASHLKTCISERLKNGDEEAVDEIIKTIGKLI